MGNKVKSTRQRDKVKYAKILHCMEVVQIFLSASEVCILKNLCISSFQNIMHCTSLFSSSILLSLTDSENSGKV